LVHLVYVEDLASRSILLLPGAIERVVTAVTAVPVASRDFGAVELQTL
jgi:hypothetical protein